ncbi:hypothetical protein [Klebsiella phage 05F01]|nr:hypothetical protein [Klebsiella phage 05F01]
MIKVTLTETLGKMSNSISIESEDINIINAFLESKGERVITSFECSFPNNLDKDKLKRVLDDI